jgi:hypothetical protein
MKARIPLLAFVRLLAILVTGARQLSEESQKTAVVVEQAKERIDANRAKFNNDMLQIAEQSAAQQA